MAAEKFKMSQERYDQLKEELHYMETVREKEVAEQIKEARSFGDLSENSEYDEAKAEQGKLYSKIAEVKNLLENAEIVENEVRDKSTVGIGSRVKVQDLEDGSEDEPYDLETSSYLSAIAAEIVFPGGVLASMMNRRLETVRDVLLHAIGSEKDSLLFYMELLLDTKNEQTAQVLRAIISEEKRHLVDLQQLLEKTR